MRTPEEVARELCGCFEDQRRFEANQGGLYVCARCRRIAAALAEKDREIERLKARRDPSKAKLIDDCEAMSYRAELAERAVEEWRQIAQDWEYREKKAVAALAEKERDLETKEDALVFAGAAAKNAADLIGILEKRLARSEKRCEELEKEADERVDTMAEVAVTRGASEALSWVLEMLNDSGISKREVEERLAALAPAEERGK